MELAAELLSPDTKRIELAGRHQLVVHAPTIPTFSPARPEWRSVFIHRGDSGGARYSRFEGAALKLEASGDLMIEAERLAFVGRSEVTLEVAAICRYTPSATCTAKPVFRTLPPTSAT